MTFLFTAPVLIRSVWLQPVPSRIFMSVADKVSVRSEAPNIGRVHYSQMSPCSFWLWDLRGQIIWYVYPRSSRFRHC